MLVSFKRPSPSKVGIESSIKAVTLTTNAAYILQKIILVEGLKLDDVQPGIYSIHCLHLRLLGAEGSPIRCILIKWSSLPSEFLFLSKELLLLDSKLDFSATSWWHDTIILSSLYIFLASIWVWCKHYRFMLWWHVHL